ncbi:MAG TPA: ATP-binding protein, partial [Ktedonobacteraceae bacterium]|nr:ATP-binding protein [Ktedonobacteraceae bacterium]
MNTTPTNNWDETNQRYLSAALSLVRNSLEQYVARIRGEPVEEKRQDTLQQALDEAASAMPAPAAITRLCSAFGLSPFERDVLLLCAGMDLDGTFSALCATAQNRLLNATTPYPTFSLALAALPNAHWDALTPTSPLRRWRLIGVGSSHALTLNPLRIDECILHYLAGISHPDERLAGSIAPLSAVSELVPS